LALIANSLSSLAAMEIFGVEAGRFRQDMQLPALPLLRRFRIDILTAHG
jgi:hypothetical protein